MSVGVYRISSVLLGVSPVTLLFGCKGAHACCAEACKPGWGLRRADTSLASIGAASSDTAACAAPNSRADPSGHNSAAYSAPSEGSRGGGGLRSIASVVRAFRQ